MDTVKEYLVPKTFGRVAYACLIVHVCLGAILAGLSSDFKKSKFEKFGCYVDKQSSAAYKTSVEQHCYLRFKETSNTSIHLYGFVLLSVCLMVLVSIVYSFCVRTNVENVEKISNDRTPNGTNGLTGPSGQYDYDETCPGFYVLYFYFIHLIVRSLLGILFTVLQHTVFYPTGFDSEFTCKLSSSDLLKLHSGNNASIGLKRTIITCENATASEKQVCSVMISVLNTAVSMVILAEVFYLWRRFDRWNCDGEFITAYLLCKRYGRDEFRPRNDALPFLGRIEDDCISNGNSSDNDIRLNNSDASLPNTEDNTTADRRASDHEITDNDLQDCINVYKGHILKQPRAPDICYDQKTNLDDIYIDLVISTARARHNFPKATARHEILKVYTKIPEDSIRLEKIRDLFYPNKDTKSDTPCTILVVGRPGIGKTVLTEKIFHDSAKEVDKVYHGKIPFFFKMRWFSFEEFLCLSLEAFLRYGTAGLDKEQFEIIFEAVLREPQRALLIFDGLDEFNSDLESSFGKSRMLPNDSDTCMAAMDLFIKLANGSMLQGATVIVSSRPTVVHFYSKINFDRSVEIIGFTFDRIEEYVNRFCENAGKGDLKPKIWNHINSSSDLLNLCYIPVNCFIICIALTGCLSDPENDTNMLPTTLTELYKTAIGHFSMHHNRNPDKTSSGKMLEKLQELAFNGMKSEQLVFNKDQFDKQMERSGLMNSLSDPIYPVKTQYCFIHLTIQEFLAAKHMVESKQSPDQIEKFITTHINIQRWHLMLQFIAGLLGERMKVSHHDYSGCVLAFAGGLSLRNEIFLPFCENDMFVIKCLRELDSEDMIKKARLDHVDTISSDRTLSTSNIEALTFVCKHLTNLNGLYLRFQRGWNISSFVNVGKLLQFRCLEYLILTVTSDSELGKEQLTRSLMNSECTLKHKHEKLNLLHLSIGMNDDCVSNICSFIKNGRANHLQILNLSHNKITSYGMQYLSEVLNNVLCPKLTSLNLDGNNIADEGVRMLCQALMQNRHQALEALFLNECSLTVQGIRYLCEFLCDECCGLERLDLGGKGIEDECVNVLCDALREKKCKITSLSLVISGKITRDCVEILSETLEVENCNITYLYLKGKFFSSNCVDIIRKLPETKACSARGLIVDYSTY